MSPVKDLLEAVERGYERSQELELAEGPGRCTKTIYEPCRFHPVDCASCRHGGVCQQRPIMQAHPDKIRSCRWYEAREVRKR